MYCWEFVRLNQTEATSFQILESTSILSPLYSKAGRALLSSLLFVVFSFAITRGWSAQCCTEAWLQHLWLSWMPGRALVQMVWVETGHCLKYKWQHVMLSVAAIWCKSHHLLVIMLVKKCATFCHILALTHAQMRAHIALFIMMKWAWTVAGATQNCFWFFLCYWSQSHGFILLSDFNIAVRFKSSTLLKKRL